METRVLSKIADVSFQEWSRVFPPVLENYYFFKSLDESDFEQFRFYYILVYENNTLVGATSCFLMDFPLDSGVQGLWKSFLGPFKKIFPKIFAVKTLICGLPMGQGRIGIAAEPDKVIKAIYACLEDMAKKEKAPLIVFKDFNKSYLDMLLPLEKKGFFRMQGLPSTDMDISFASFAKYLKKLSPASRSGLKRKFKKVDGNLKISLEVKDALEDGELLEAYQLYSQTIEKQVIKFEVVPMEFFKKISENMPQEVKFFLWRMDKRLVSFAFCLVSQGWFIDYYLGFDYSLAYENHLYFIRFRDLLNWCIENKIKKYEMGPTSYEPKRRLGFDFIPLYIYFRHRNKWLAPLCKLFCHLLKPENFDPVFKKIKKQESPENSLDLV